MVTENIATLREKFDHPSWFSAAGVVLGYAIVLAVLTVLMFGVPWLVFLFL